MIQDKSVLSVVYISGSKVPNFVCKTRGRLEKFIAAIICYFPRNENFFQRFHAFFTVTIMVLVQVLFVYNKYCSISIDALVREGRILGITGFARFLLGVGLLDPCSSCALVSLSPRAGSVPLSLCECKWWRAGRLHGWQST